MFSPYGSFANAQREWDAEIEEEATRLLKLGVPPWDAVIQARQRIERKRRKEAMRQAGPEGA